MSTTKTSMDRVEINRSIMELNFRKEKLQNEIDAIQAHINHLVAIREMKQFEETPLFDELFGG
jgi:regulator of replication initiation timing